MPQTCEEIDKEVEKEHTKYLNCVGSRRFFGVFYKWQTTPVRDVMIITHNRNYECKYLYFKVLMKGFSYLNPINMDCKVYDPTLIHFFFIIHSLHSKIIVQLVFKQRD